jgi:hypothetical protein
LLPKEAVLCYSEFRKFFSFEYIADELKPCKDSEDAT